MSTKRNNYQAVSSQSLNNQNSSQAWEELTDKQAETVRGGIDLGTVVSLLGSGGSGQWINATAPGLFNIQNLSGRLGGTQGQAGTGTFQVPGIGEMRLNWGNFTV